MSDEAGKQLEDRVKALAAGWTAALAAVVALLYVAGYLSLRFQLDALGVAADLDVVDERHLFEGAHVGVRAADVAEYLEAVVRLRTSPAVSSC